MKFRPVFEIIRNFLAIVGLISIVGAAGSLFFVVKSYNYPPHVIGMKILKKAGLGDTSLAKALKPAPIKPAGLKMPDQGAADWSGHGAVNSRELLPVIYFKNSLPIPQQWKTMADLSPVTVQKHKRTISVQDSKQFIRAIKKAMAGDIITLEPGRYVVKAYNISINSPGTAKMPICVRAKKLGQVVIEFDTLEGFLINAPYWIFENLDIKGITKNHDRGEHAFHIIGKGNGFVLRNSRIHEFNSMIKANGSKDSDGKRTYPDGVLIENNTFYNSEIRRTSNPVTFIDVVGPDNWIIRGNFISDFAKGEGDQISYAAFIKGNASGSVFENNLVIGEYRHTGGVRVGLSFGGGGTGNQFFRNGKTDVEHSNGIIRNNIIMYCPDVAVYLNKAANTKVYNNTFYKTRGIDIRFPESSAVIKNNLLTGRINNRDGGKSIRNYNLIVPKKSFFKKGFSDWFVNPDNLDFALKNQGPFIDKGEFLSEIYEDICGNPRVETPDIGAFEYNDTKICKLIGKK